MDGIICACLHVAGKVGKRSKWRPNRGLCRRKFISAKNAVIQKIVNFRNWDLAKIWARNFTTLLLCPGSQGKYFLAYPDRKHLPSMACFVVL